MKLLLTTLGAVAITGSSVAVLSNSTNNLVSTQQKISVEEFTSPGTLSNSSQIIEEYLNNNQDSTLKEDILNSLFFSNEKIEINVSILEQYKTNSPLFLILTGEELKDQLLKMYQSNLLFYNTETKLFSFLEDEVSTQSWSIWAVSHWYWFGYWKLCFNHQAARDLATLITIGATLAELASKIWAWSGPLKVGTDIIAAFLLVNAMILTNYDEGNGVWIGFWAVIPDLGWEDPFNLLLCN